MLTRLLHQLRVAMVAPVLAGALAGLAPAALAQDWPSRPVTLVVPYGPGASNDTFTRAIAEVLTRDLGQPFVVDNRPGAGGFTGSNSVKNAEGDGYIFLEAPSAIAGLGPIGKVELDALADFKPVGLLATSPTAMAINASIPADNVQEFIAWVNENPDKASPIMARRFDLTPDEFRDVIKNIRYFALEEAAALMGADNQRGELHGIFDEVMQLNLENGAADTRLSADRQIDNTIIS